MFYSTVEYEFELFEDNVLDLSSVAGSAPVNSPEVVNLDAGIAFTPNSNVIATCYWGDVTLLISGYLIPYSD